jgi:hypothetical protein
MKLNNSKISNQSLIEFRSRNECDLIEDYNDIDEQFVIATSNQNQRSKKEVIQLT